MIPSAASPTTYTGTVPAPQEASAVSCPISAEYYSANGVWSYVAENTPVFIGEPIVEPVEIDVAPIVQPDDDRDDGHRHDDRNQTQPTATPTPQRVAPTPTPPPKPVYRRDPVVIMTPAPIVRSRAETSTPAPKATKPPDAR